MGLIIRNGIPYSGTNVQPDWNANQNSPAYIKNKPTIPTKLSELDNDSNFVIQDVDEEEYSEFGRVYAGYGGAMVSSSIHLSVEKLSKYSMLIFSYSPEELEYGQFPSDQFEVIRLIKQNYPHIKIYSYISAASEHDGYYLDEDGNWDSENDAQRIYNRHELIQYFHDVRHINGIRTGEYDSDDYEIMTGGLALDGVMLDEFGADTNMEPKWNQGGYINGNPRWYTAADKWNDILEQIHLCGISAICNTWESEQMLRECIELTPNDTILVETVEFYGDENVTGYEDVYWCSYNSAKRIYDLTHSQYYVTANKPKILSYSTLNRDLPVELKQRAYTWALFDTLAMGGHYVYISWTDDFDTPDEMYLFKTPITESYVSEYVEKGYFRLTTNGHVLETFRSNADAENLVTEKNMDLVKITIDGVPFKNVCVDNPQLEYSTDKRISEMETKFNNYTSNKKGSAPEYVRMQIDDWKPEITISDYTNYIPDTFNNVAGMRLTIENINGLYNISGTNTDAWGRGRHKFSAELLEPFLGKTIEIGCNSLSVQGASDFDNSLGFFIAVDDVTYSITNVDLRTSICDGQTRICKQITIPNSTGLIDMGFQSSNHAINTNFSMSGLYMVVVDEITEGQSKGWYTNILPLPSEEWSQNSDEYWDINCNFDSVEDSSGHTAYDVSGEFTWDWGRCRKNITGSELSQYIGHTLELGCTSYTILNSDDTPYDESLGALRLILGESDSSDNYIVPSTNNISMCGNTSGLCIRYIVPDNATNLIIGWQSRGGSNGLKFVAEGVYVYDLNEEGIFKRGVDPANSYLQFARVTNDEMEKDSTLLSNALYFTEENKIFMTNYSKEMFPLNVDSDTDEIELTLVIQGMSSNNTTASKNGNVCKIDISCSGNETNEWTTIATLSSCIPTSNVYGVIGSGNIFRQVRVTTNGTVDVNMVSNEVICGQVIYFI